MPDLPYPPPRLKPQAHPTDLRAAGVEAPDSLPLADARPQRLLLVAEREPAATLRALLAAAFPQASLVVAREFDSLWKMLTEYDTDMVVCARYPVAFDLLAAIRLIRAHAPGAPLIIAGGEAGDTMGAELMLRGADDYVPRDCLARLPAVILRERRRASLQARHDRLLERLRDQELLLRDRESEVPDRAEPKRGAAQARLHGLATNMLEMHDGERNRLAAELHDEVGQPLGAIRIELARAAAGATQGLESATGATQALAGQLGSICAALRGVELRDDGLVAALRALAARRSAAASIELVIEPSGERPRAPRAIEITALRIAELAVADALRRAPRARMRIGLRFEPRQLFLSIDDESGFGASPVSAAVSAAVSTAVSAAESAATRSAFCRLAELAEALGGTLDIEGNGTRIRASLPFDGADD